MAFFPFLSISVVDMENEKNFWGGCCASQEVPSMVSKDLKDRVRDVS